MSVITNQYLIPASLNEALHAAVSMEGSFKFIAGGTDVMVNRYQGNELAACLIDISNLPELQGVGFEGDLLRIGALEKLHSLHQNHLIKTEFPLVAEAALSVGSPLVRKAATIGGNVLCENRCLFYNQSEWWRTAVGFCLKCEGEICIATGGKNACFSEMVSDMAPALIVLDASVEIMDSKGIIVKKLEEIYTGDGVNPRNIPANAIITSFLIPRNGDQKTSFQKLRERESLEFTSLTMAMTLRNDGRVKICLSGVDPKPVVIETDKSYGIDEVIHKALKGARTVQNDILSRTHRRNMIRTFIRQGYRDLGLL